jgi:hypothetical protein
VALVLGAAMAAISSAQSGTALNDLFAIGLGSGQTLTPVAQVTREEPPFVATPRAQCGAGSHPEPGIQGRVPAGSASNGLSCNVTVLSHEGQSGGFKTLRYIDTTGRECAYYDTALLLPLNAFNAAGTSLGVRVLDMTDPEHPIHTDSLTAPPMLSPHESVTLNQRRGLIAAVNGNPATEPGLVAIYDAHADCRHPVLQSLAPVARFGHESGFAPDGNTFYATGTATPTVTAIDVSDPKNPHAIWEGNITVHGMTLSPDGNRGYLAAIGGRGMIVLDTSEIQARKPNPQAHEVSWLTWKSATIPQNNIRFTEDGHPYILSFDEYTDQAGSSTNGARFSGDPNKVGAARIIDISDETAPRVVANLRLQVNQPANHAEAANDPGAFSPVQGYAAHYCNVDTPVDPKVVACSFIASGLRVFDISDVTAPKEIAYYVAPTQSKIENGFQASSYAMSQPAFAPSRHEVWFTDGTGGFYALRVAASVWPGATSASNTNSSRQNGTLSRSSAVPRGSAAAANPAAAAAATGSTGSGTLPFTGQDLRLPFLIGLVLVLLGTMLRRVVTADSRRGRSPR